MKTSLSLIASAKPGSFEYIAIFGFTIPGPAAEERAATDTTATEIK